jgi:hypothetical protein
MRTIIIVKKGQSASLSLLQSVCSIYCDVLTDLTITVTDAWPLDDHINALMPLRVIERLTLSNTDYLNDEDLIKLTTHRNLPVTLKHLSWNWRRSEERRGLHYRVRQAFASRGILCHDYHGGRGA